MNRLCILPWEYIASLDWISLLGTPIVFDQTKMFATTCRDWEQTRRSKSISNGCVKPGNGPGTPTYSMNILRRLIRKLAHGRTLDCLGQPHPMVCLLRTRDGR